MGYILDTLIFVFFGFMVYKNLKKTQLRSIIEALAYLGAAIFSVPISRVLSSFCYTSFFRAPMAKRIVNVVNEAAHVKSNTPNLERILEMFPSAVRNSIDSYQLRSPAVREQIDSLLVGNVTESPVKIVDILVQPVITGIFSAAFYLIFFCGLLYLFSSLGASVENIVYSPDGGVYNTVLGGVLGGFKGIVIMLIFITFLQLMVPALPLGIKAISTEQLSKSFLFRLFYEQNAIMLFLGKGIYPTDLV